MLVSGIEMSISSCFVLSRPANTRPVLNRFQNYCTVTQERMINCINKLIACRVQLAQWKTVFFVKFRLVRQWFESCRMPSLFHGQIIRMKCMTSRLRNESEGISQPRNQNQNYCCRMRNFWAKGNIA